MCDESFYGVTLSSENNVASWDVLSNDEDFPRGQKLIIKQMLLGAEAEEGEFNVVEVFTAKDSLRIPLAVLKAGETRVTYPDVEFFETAVTFKLIKGSGPVYIHGQNIKDEVEVVDMDDEASDEDVDEEDEIEAQPNKKPRTENNSDGKNLKTKKNKINK